VTNAVKHGKAKNVEIRLAKGENQFRLSIHNDGTPLPSAVNKNGGLGLRIMSYRAHLIGATLEVKAGKTQGTVVTCSLPCPEGYTGAATTRSTTPLEMA